jgi:hypothetical protein
MHEAEAVEPVVRSKGTFIRPRFRSLSSFFSFHNVLPVQLDLYTFVLSPVNRPKIESICLSSAGAAHTQATHVLSYPISTLTEENYTACSTIFMERTVVSLITKQK